jgi:diguanylate cyclase (GGDEF)-like protein/PAS domain S-box-containing protein
VAIDWAGRVARSGMFLDEPAHDLLALLQAALDAVPEAFLAVVDAERRVLLARGGLLPVDSGGDGDPDPEPDPRTPSAELSALIAALEPAIEAGLQGSVAEALVPWQRGGFVDVRVGPVHDDGGQVVACVLIAHDVTARRAVHVSLTEEHEALLESQERYRLLAENSSDFVMRTTPDGVIEWVSDGMTELLGWPLDEIVGKRSLDFAHPDFLAQVVTQVSAVNVGEVVSGRIQVRHQDGSYRWMHRTLRPLRDENGEVVARVSGWHDATPEVEAEERLAASEEMFRVAMDSSAIGMALVGREGRFLRVNPAYCAMVGYDAEELGSMRFQDLTHPDDVERGESDGTRVVRAQSDGFRQRKRYITKSGRPLWVDVSVAGVRAPDGAFRHLIVQAVDVSAEVANFEALQRAARDYQTLAENASDVVMRVDSAGLIQWISPSVRSVLGWDPELLIGTPSISLVEHEDREQVLGVRDRILHEGVTSSSVARFRTTSGTTVEMSGTGRPVVDERGTVVGQVIGLRDVSEEMAIRRELAHRASHDALTGVVNRDELLTRLTDRLGRDGSDDDKAGLVFCDVDELKVLNDTWGHARGDAVLVEVARALESAVRRHDLVARLSGDEFVIMVDRVPDEEALRAIEDSCRRAVAGILRPDGETTMSISVGAILAVPGDDAAALIDRADRAMMRDKERGRVERGLRARSRPQPSLYADGGPLEPPREPGPDLG